MTGNLTSIAVDILWHDNVALHFIYTGTPTGEFFVDVSNDDENWATVTLRESSLALGAAGNNFIDTKFLGGRYVRARYVAASGTGTLNAWITAKSL